MSTEMTDPKSAVLGNADLLRLIGGYLIGGELPFILSFKAVRSALKPLNTKSGQKWIQSDQQHFISSITMVQWAFSLGCEFDVTGEINNLFIDAASSGSVDVLRWAHEKFPPEEYPAAVRYDVAAQAAERNQLEVLDYLRSLGSAVRWNRFVFERAARGGHLPVLQWLREALDPPCPWSLETCNKAAYAGHLHVLQWLRAQNPPCPWGEWTCNNAAESGHLHILQWLRSQDPPCPWGEYTCDYAASRGYFEMLKWLRSQEPPCPWDKRSCIEGARENNQYEVVEWILPQLEDDSDEYTSASDDEIDDGDDDDEGSDDDDDDEG